MEFLRSVHFRNIIFVAAGAIALIGTVFSAIPTGVDAQGTCVWEEWECTVTPPATATGTITATSTAQITPIVFQAPEYDVPTSIPAISFPEVPAALQFTPIPAPSVISIEITPMPTPDYNSLGSLPITPTATITMSSISTSINLSTTTPLSLSVSLTGTNNISGTGAISDALGAVGNWMDGVTSYTTWLSGEASSIYGSETITVLNAPDWYAPAMPRPMADVGWTYEQLTDPDGSTQEFSLSSWASFFGYSSSLPFQIVKSLWELVAYFGPFGLFLGWLLIMFLIVLAIHLQIFIVRFILLIVRLVLKVIDFIVSLIPFI